MADSRILLSGTAAQRLHQEGLAFLSAGQYENAELCMRDALSLAPEQPAISINLAAVLAFSGRYTEAQALNAAVLERAPGDILARQNLAVVLANQGNMTESVGHYRHLLAEAGEGDPGLCLNAAFGFLKAGLWDDGWRLYEARYSPDLADKLAKLPASIDLPRWTGGAASGRRLLVVGEQGLGDQVMFGRYLPALKSQGFEVAGIMVAPPLVEAFRLAGLADHVYGSTREIAEPYDCFAFLGSLPLLLGVTDPGAGWHGPYLRPREGAGANFSVGSGRLRVGVVWSGNRNNRDARFVAKYRFFSPQVLAPLFDCETLDCYSLQQGAVEGELTHSRVARLGSGIASIQDTVDRVAQMDAIVTADTSIAHVAGALGKPTFVLLPITPDWRWGAEGVGTAWYPSVKLLRSSRLGGWDDLVRQVLAELETLG